MESKLRKVGTRFRWLGIAVFLVGVLLAVTESSGGVVIIALGLITAIQGAIIEYSFRQ